VGFQERIAGYAHFKSAVSREHARAEFEIYDYPGIDVRSRDGGGILTLEVGRSSITLTPASISLSSPMIKLN
jgi:hypothetical protein